MNHRNGKLDSHILTRSISSSLELAHVIKFFVLKLITCKMVMVIMMMIIIITYHKYIEVNKKPFSIAQ